MNLITELEARGLVFQHSAENLEEILNTKRTLYFGADPSADSLHVGNLVGYIMAQRLMNEGHKTILLVGGATGLIGDPSGKSSERDFVDGSVVAGRVKNIQKQIKAIDGLSSMQMVNNADWFKKMGTLEFLREVGKHFTVNTMMKRESVSKRIQSDQGISFTEFSYALIQGYDYYHLHTHHGCDLQIGGSDQWGNIISGVDFIRKKTGNKVYAMTLPLVVDKKTGKKFGKSEGNAVWLDPQKTSYYDFYQFWLNTDDINVGDYLKMFTFLSLEEIADLEKQTQSEPHMRAAQKALAYEVTKFVHGVKIADDVKQVAEMVFSTDPMWERPSSEIALIEKYAPLVDLNSDVPVADFLVEHELASSKREAKQFIEGSAIKINNVPVAPQSVIELKKAPTKIIVVTRGKKHKVMVRIKKK